MYRWFRHIISLVIWFPISALFLYVAFGRVDSQAFLPHDVTAVVTLRNFVETTDKALSSNALRKLIHAGLGGNSFAQMLQSMDELKEKSWMYPIVASLTPELTLALTGEMDWYTANQAPILSLVDVGRPLLLLDGLGLTSIIKHGERVGTYSGVPLSVRGSVTTALVRNMVIMGQDKEVKRAIDVYLGRAPGVGKWNQAIESARGKLSRDAEITGVLLSSKALTPTVRLGGDVTKSLIPEATFEGGAFGISLTSEGVRAEAVLNAPSGKSVFPFLQSGERAFPIAGYVPDQPLFTLGMRAEDLTQLTPTLMEMTRYVGKLKDDTEIENRKKFLEIVYKNILAAIGPDLLYFTDSNGGMNAVIQLKNEGGLQKILDGYRNKDIPRTDEQRVEIVRAALKAEGALEKLLRTGILTIDDIRSVRSALPKESLETFDSLLPALEKIGKADFPGFTFLGSTFFYTTKDGLAFFSTSTEELDRMVHMQPAGSLSNIRVFFDGDPTGSFFVATDVKKKLIDGLSAVDVAQFESQLRGPWAIVLQVRDNVSQVTVDGGLQADLEIVPAPPANAWLYRAAMIAVQVLALAFGLFAVYRLIRRFRKLGADIIGFRRRESEPAPPTAKAKNRRK